MESWGDASLREGRAQVKRIVKVSYWGQGQKRHENKRKTEEHRDSIVNKQKAYEAPFFICVYARWNPGRNGALGHVCAGGEGGMVCQNPSCITGQTLSL
jgi:hypothetical protein